MLKEAWERINDRWKLGAIKVCLNPGDFVMWDSRVIHCNTPPKRKPVTEVSDDGTIALRRLVAYICMTPADHAKDKSVLERKIEGYKKGVTTNHWPHEFKDHVAGYDIPKGFQVPPLTPYQQELITGGIIPFA